jgi:hypothetical protein
MAAERIAKIELFAAVGGRKLSAQAGAVRTTPLGFWVDKFDPDAY